MNAMPPAWPSAAPWHTPPAYHYGPAAHAHHAAYAPSGASSAASNQRVEGEPAQVAGHTAGTHAARPWHTVLGVPQDQATVEFVTRRYFSKKRVLNPETASGKIALLELRAAYESAMEALAVRASLEETPRANVG